MPKRELRQMLLASRRSLTCDAATEYGRIIQRSFMAMAEFSRATVVGLYSPVHNEVDTALVLEALLETSRTPLYPVVNHGILEFRRVTGPDCMRRGAFGILEPDNSCEAVTPAQADLIVVPGIAFDVSGKRIGYGKGCYDKALHHLEGGGKLIGFCYDFQLVDAIAGEPHDVTMDLLITEKRVIRPRD